MILVEFLCVLGAAIADACLGFVFPRCDIVFDDFNVCQPDAIVVLKERRSIITPLHIRGAPDLLVEVLSESTRLKDVKIKSEIYARFGVPRYWIVDPDADKVECYRLDAGAYVLELEATKPATVDAPGVPGLRLDLAKLLPELPAA